MAIRFIQTLGAVAGIFQWTGGAVIDCAKPTRYLIGTGGANGPSLSKPAPYQIVVTPTVFTRR